MRYLMARGFVTRRTEEAMDYVSLILPMAVGSVDRLDEVPDRLKFLFEFDPTTALTRAEVAEVVHTDGAKDVIVGLADELRNVERLDREAFRAAANRVKQKTGQKGRSLFGPELDIAVPAIDRGAELPRSSGVALILGCRERAEMFARAVR
jgi:hypothetical protein